MTEIDYRIIDADNHYYEPEDCYTRYMEPAMRDKAIRLVEHEGNRQVMVGDRPFTFLENPFRDTAVRPGGLRDMLRNLSSRTATDPDDTDGLVEAIRPAYIDRTARLEAMDAQQVEACLMLPSLGVCTEHFMKHDVAQTYANLRAFNRWLDDDWGYAYRERIFAPPLLSLLDVDLAVEELDRVLAAGARAVHLRPGPQAGRSPADPHFDPFWARANEAQVPVAFHISESGYNELYSTAWNELANPSSHHQSAFQWTCFYGDRPIMETMAALIFHNLFGRFPNVKVVSLENGSLWVPYIMKAMDKMKGMGRNGPWPGGRPDGRPSEIFREHVYVAPYHEEDILSLVELLGPTRVLLGSDWPHPEGVAEPLEFAARLRGLSDEDVRRIMRDNGAELLGLSV